MNEWFLAGRGESLGSRKGVGEVLLPRWILQGMPGRQKLIPAPVNY